MVRLSGGSLKDADLSAAKLVNAKLTAADLWRANLKDVSLYKADLTSADVRGVITNGVKLCNTIMPDGSFIYSGC